MLAGAAVALALGVYGREHEAAGQALFTLGFSGTINMKAWLATVALVAGASSRSCWPLWMYGKLGRPLGARLGRPHPPADAAPLALLVTLPVVYHCLWSLGFETDSGSTRRYVHSLLGLRVLRRVHDQGAVRALGPDCPVGRCRWSAACCSPASWCSG